eukprot:g8011.t1
MLRGTRDRQRSPPAAQGVVVALRRGGAPCVAAAAAAARPRARATRARGARAGAGAAALCLAWGCGLLGGAGVGLFARADDALNVIVNGTFEFAGKQLTVLTEEVLTEEGVFTDYTDTDGQWLTTKDNGDNIEKEVWTSGMVAGMFWYQYEATGEQAMKTAAEFYLKGLEGVEEIEDNDTGFQVLNSYGLGYRLSESEAEKEEYLGRVLTGAENLHGFKWDANIPAFWSWENPSRRPEWDRAVNVDMIMNMEIMLWAKLHGGEDYDADVEGHADTTWQDIVRADNSTNHVAAYDVDTGELLETGTYQGYADNSTWTRGQAWAIYGYAMIYRYVPQPRFLSRSLGLLAYWEQNLPADYVPPADFDAPVSASDNGKDSSATAIVASALLEIFIITGEPIYLVKAQTHLSALLQADYYLPDATDGYQSILRRATAEWGDPEVGATFGDYFLLEAMVRYKKLAPSILLWQEAPVEIAVSGARRRRRRLVLEDTQELEVEQEVGWEEEEEEEEDAPGHRSLQELTGGEFCALDVTGGTLAFADADCVPVPPTLQPVAMTGAPVLQTPAPAAGTPAPTITATVGPTAGGTVLQASGTTAVYGAAALDNDVDLSCLSTSSPIIIRLGVTLSNTNSTPATLSLENGSILLATDIPAPDAGWQAGSNSVTFEVPVGTFVPAAWTQVVEVTVGFEAAPTAVAGDATSAAVDWLVITNELIL